MRFLIAVLKWIHGFTKRGGGNIALPPMRFWFISRFIRTGLTDTFAAEVDEGDIVVDVGANIGYYSILASKLVGSAGMVHAFEPDPAHFDKLVRNLEMNRCANAVAENKGLSDSTGMLKLYLSEENSSDHATYPVDGRQSVEVPVASLDDYCTENRLDRVDFIKIDVQGFEPSVLDGMSDTLERNRGVRVLSEFWPGGIERAQRDPSTYLESFTNRGFELFLVEERKVARPISAQEAIQLAAEREDLDLLFKRPISL